MKATGVRSIVLAVVLATCGAQASSPGVYTIDGARSRIELTVYRGGLLKMIGHDHAIAAKNFSGRVRFNPENMGDSSVEMDIDARSLVVLDDPNVSEKDRKQIQKDMQGAKVLDIRSFPQIAFHSTEVSRTASTPDGLTLHGRLNLHGVEKEIAFPVRVDLKMNRLHVAGTAVVAQTDFGIKPITVAAGGIRVKDRVNVTFEIFAQKAE